jgi:hypothetical protein
MHRPQVVENDLRKEVRGHGHEEEGGEKEGHQEEGSEEVRDLLASLEHPTKIRGRR